MKFKLPLLLSPTFSNHPSPLHSSHQCSRLESAVGILGGVVAVQQLLDVVVHRRVSANASLAGEQEESKGEKREKA